MKLTVASYNIHKAVGLDRRRDPDRILSVLREIDADVVALQEADRRFGRRASVLPLQALADHTPYAAVPLNHRPDSIGWHGNALLIAGRRVRVVGMHLDLSGLRRRQQLRTIFDHIDSCGPPCPAVLMGDLNEWALRGGALREFQPPWRLLAPGRSFPSRQPLAQFDRFAVSPEWQVLECGVHHSALAARASDRLELPEN
jgi:endonuclease/exonuclease/phosphatase family metal-dependent hydrolase